MEDNKPINIRKIGGAEILEIVDKVRQEHGCQIILTDYYLLLNTI